MEEPEPNRRTASTDDGHEARRQRDRELTMSQRLEQLSRLCAQLAQLEPVGGKRSD
jgi:hypothetical protein